MIPRTAGEARFMVDDGVGWRGPGGGSASADDDATVPRARADGLAETIILRREQAAAPVVVVGGTPPADDETTLPVARPDDPDPTIVRAGRGVDDSDDTVVRQTPARGSTDDTVVSTRGGRSGSARSRVEPSPSAVEATSTGHPAAAFQRVAFVPVPPSHSPTQRYRARVATASTDGRRTRGRTPAPAPRVAPLLGDRAYLIREANRARRRLIIGAVVVIVVSGCAIAGVVLLLSV